MLLHLEAKFEKGFRQAIEALKQIKGDKLYREVGFTTFEDYLQIRWSRTRSWAYQQLTWLDAVEYLEAQNVQSPLQNLSVDAAQVFKHWESRPEVFYGAFKRIVQDKAEPTKERLEQETAVQADFLADQYRTPDLTFQEYQAYRRLDALPVDHSFPEDVQSVEQCIAICQEMKARPTLETICKVARGEALSDLVDQLMPLVQKAAEIKKLEARLMELEQIKRDENQKYLDEIHKLEEMIAEVGEEPDDEIEEEDASPEQDEKSDDAQDDDHDEAGGGHQAESGPDLKVVRCEEPETDAVEPILENVEQIDIEANLLSDPQRFLQDVLDRIKLFRGYVGTKTLVEVKGPNQPDAFGHKYGA